MQKKIFRPGKRPRESNLEFGPDGFAVWFQRDEQGNVFVIVQAYGASRYTGQPVLYTCGVVLYKEITVDNPGTIATLCADKTFSTKVPTVYDGVLLVKSHWRLTRDIIKRN